MEYTEIVNLIGSLGFPIAMCLLLYIKMGKQDEQHREEMTKITESLNNNTIAITKLSAKLDIKGEC